MDVQNIIVVGKDTNKIIKEIAKVDKFIKNNSKLIKIKNKKSSYNEVEIFRCCEDGYIKFSINGSGIDKNFKSIMKTVDKILSKKTVIDRFNKIELDYFLLPERAIKIIFNGDK